MTDKTTEKPKMQYQNLGKSGLKVSKIILGTMSYGSSDWQGWVLNEDKALPLLEHAYNVGLRTWDTADIYSHGRSEEIIAKAIQQFKIPRERLVLLSKCYWGITPDNISNPVANVSDNDGDLLNQVGLSRKKIIDSVENSCRRLGTYIDVLQIHRLDRATPREEIMKALNDVIESGKVRYIGASSMAAWEFQELQNVADKHGWHKFISMQDYYNLIYREEEREMIPYCNHTGVGLIPWSPVARGALTRPFDGRSTLRESTDNYLKSWIRGRESKVDEEIIGRVEEVAKKMGISMAQIAIAWTIGKGCCPIVGLNSVDRIDEAVAACSVKLSEEDTKYLEEPYAPKEIQGY